MTEPSLTAREWVFTPQRFLIFFVGLLAPWVAAIAGWNFAWQRIDEIPCSPVSHMPVIPAYMCVLFVSTMCWVGAAELYRRCSEWFLVRVEKGAQHV